MLAGGRASQKTVGRTSIRFFFPFVTIRVARIFARVSFGASVYERGPLSSPERGGGGFRLCLHATS